MTSADDVPVRDAATVVLLRDGSSGPEAWLLTRVRQMVFAGGMSVFPGGQVDPADAELPFSLGAADATRHSFDCDEPAALALLGAAVRETFEETGVLLTDPPAQLPHAVADVEAGRLGFGELLRRHGLTVDARGLRPWAHWVTPPGEVRRYDTRFFVCALPQGAEARDVTSESSSASWVPAVEALAQADRGERGLMPPTLIALRTVAAHGTVAEVLAAAPTEPLAPVSPSLRREDGRIFAELPDGASFELPRSLFP